MKTITALLLTLPLSGCWFIYIPGSAIDAVADGLSGAKGNGCVQEYMQVGGRVRMPNGGMGTVKYIDGPSYRCSSLTPIRALVTMD
jgi:hypothetical protein